MRNAGWYHLSMNLRNVGFLSTALCLSLICSSSSYGETGYAPNQVSHVETSQPTLIMLWIDGWVTAGAFTSGSPTIALGTHKGTAYVMDCESCVIKTLPLAGGGGNISSLVFSPDRTLLAVGYKNNSTVTIWDLRSCKLVTTIPTIHSAGFLRLAFSRDGRLLYAGGAFQDNTITCLSIEKREQVKSVPTSGKSYAGTSSMALSPDGNMLACGSQSADGAVTVFRLPEMKVLHRLKTRGQKVELAFSFDSKILASRSVRGRESYPWEGVDFWEMKTGKSLAVIDSLAATPLMLGEKRSESSSWRLPDNFLSWMSPDATKEVQWNERDIEIEIRDRVTGRRTVRDLAQYGGADIIKFSPDGKQLILGHCGIFCMESGTIWDLSTCQPHTVSVHDLPNWFIKEDTSTSTDLALKCAKELPGARRIWRDKFPWNDDEQVVSPSHKDHAISRDGKLQAVFSGISRDGVRLVFSGTSVTLTDMAAGTSRTFDTAGMKIHCVAFSPDGRLLAAAGEKPNAMVTWDVSTGTITAHSARNAVASRVWRSLPRGIWSQRQARMESFTYGM